MIIAVSGINATDNPGPGVAVARSLKEANSEIEVIGLSYDINDPGNYLKQYIDKSYILNIPTQGWAGIFEKIKRIKELNGLDIIIPCLDAELPLYIRYQEDLRKIGISVFLPTEAQFEMRDKSKLSLLAKDIGFKYPETYKLYSEEDLEKIVEEKELEFPLIIKGNYYKAYKVESLEECKIKFKEISDEWGFPMLLQEIVEGEELNLVGVGDGNGSHLGLFSIKKLTTTSIGKIWSGVSINNEKLIKAAEEFISKTKWKGPFELECIFDDEECYLIEINPRFPAWVYFPTGSGMNLVENMVNSILEKEVIVNKEIPVGKLFVRYTEEIVTNIQDIGKIG